MDYGQVHGLVELSAEFLGEAPFGVLFLFSPVELGMRAGVVWRLVLGSGLTVLVLSLPTTTA